MYTYSSQLVAMPPVKVARPQTIAKPKVLAVRDRNIGIDFLRGLAVLLVLVNHCNHISSTQASVWDLIRKGSWVGVDLFFVLQASLYQDFYSTS